MASGSAAQTKGLGFSFLKAEALGLAKLMQAGGWRTGELVTRYTERRSAGAPTSRRSHHNRRGDVPQARISQMTTPLTDLSS